MKEKFQSEQRRSNLELIAQGDEKQARLCLRNALDWLQWTAMDKYWCYPGGLAIDTITARLEKLNNACAARIAQRHAECEASPRWQAFKARVLAGE